jgi:hypothetical protein
MADVMSILSSNYLTVGANVNISGSKYVNVDPASFEGSWTGKYSDGKSFAVSVSDVSGFRAKVKYQSGSTTNYQDVLIKDNAFRIGDSKFILQRAGVAQIKTVTTDPASGATSLLTAYANQNG